MLPTFTDPMKIVAKLEPGLAVNHLEGPIGNRFINRDLSPVWWNPFYPVVGIARPFDFIRQCVEEARQDAAIRVNMVNDIENADLLFTLLEKYIERQPETEYEIVTLLRDAAIDIGGEAQADRILSLWMRIDQIEKYLGTLDFGPLFIMTCVLTRWTTRPLLPFPHLYEPGTPLRLSVVLDSRRRPLLLGHAQLPPEPVPHDCLAVVAPAFSADCIETLEEINEEIKESFEEAGGEHFTYIPCLNDSPAHVDALVEAIEDNLKGWT
jgi:hypothetical protein